MISNNRGNKGDDSGHSGFKTGLGSEHGGLCHDQLEDRRLGSQGEGAHWGRWGLQVEDFALKKLHPIIATLSCCVCVFVYFQHDFTLSISCQCLLTSYISEDLYSLSDLSLLLNHLRLVEASGAPPMVNSCFSLLRKGAKLVLIGQLRPR